MYELFTWADASKLACRLRAPVCVCYTEPMHVLFENQTFGTILELKLTGSVSCNLCVARKI
jgi:hypothetical protein